MKNVLAIKYLREIRKLVGPDCCHENLGSFTYYTSGDYLTVKAEGSMEVSVHRIFTDCDLKVEIDLTNAIPNRRDILTFLKLARNTARRVKGDHFEKIRLKKIEILKNQIEILENNE